MTEAAPAHFGVPFAWYIFLKLFAFHLGESWLVQGVFWNQHSIASSQVIWLDCIFLLTNLIHLHTRLILVGLELTAGCFIDCLLMVLYEIKLGEVYKLSSHPVCSQCLFPSLSDMTVAWILVHYMTSNMSHRFSLVHLNSYFFVFGLFQKSYSQD